MLSPGQSFGNYRILEKIGVGGMGAVYLAQHPLIGKKVALKVIHNELSANKEVITRFFNEARAANQIGHEHIVQIHDFGQTDDGQHFYIMEYIEGRTLAQALLRDRTLHPQRVLHVAAQIASGLQAAHEKNIIHRDLKPDNIMLVNRLGDADFVKILDFGLAKLLDNQRQLTAIGVVLGTPQYMSPEACESRQDIDRRSDIYSLGILMFQMLTGRVPFEGASMGEVLVKQVTKLPPAPRALNPVVPPSIEQIVLRCLAKDRNVRFPSMGDLRHALLNPEKYLASSPPVVQAAGGPPEASGNRTQMFAGAPDGGDQILATLPPLGLAPGPAAPPSDPVGPAAQKTAFLAGSAAPANAPPPPEARPPSHAVKTQYGGPNRPANGQGGGPPGAVGPAARTAYMAAPGAAASGAPPAPEPPRRGSADAKTAYMGPGAAGAGPPGPVMPELSPPTPARNVTMAIAPPPGYSERPPRGSWSIIAAAAGVSLVIGFLFLGFVSPGFLRAGEVAEPSAAPPLDAAVATAPPPVDAAAALPDARATARIEVRSDPPGAEVVSGEGEVLATTPGVIEIPVAQTELVWTFRHPEAEPQTATVVPSGDTRIQLTLAPKAENGRKKPRRKKRKRTDVDGTLTPDFN